MTNRVRYTVDNVSNNRFYQMPKFLFEGELKEGLSNDAKVLYSLLRDRHELSLQNEWINENREVYLIYTRETMQEMLGLSDKTVKKALDQLKQFGLLEEERLGFNRANRIYLTAVSLDFTGHGDFTTPDTEILRLRTRKFSDTGHGNITILESENFRPNDTNINNTNINNTDYQSINQEIIPFDRIDRIDALIKPSIPDSEDSMPNNFTDSVAHVIADNIAFSHLKERFNQDSLISDIFNLMVEVVTSNKKYIRVNGEDKPSDIVKSVFMKLDQFHIEYVIDTISQSTTKANNIRAYLITTLYNAPSTINTYYTNMVMHNSYGKQN